MKTDGDSYPGIWYTSAGKDLGKRLWEETMREFEPFGVAKIIEDLEKTQFGDRVASKPRTSIPTERRTEANLI